MTRGSVPIPPEPITIVREHIEEFGTAADGRLSRTATGDMIYDHTSAWAAARTLALTLEQVASPLAARPYDLRHAAVSLWLNDGSRPRRWLTVRVTPRRRAWDSNPRGRVNALMVFKSVGGSRAAVAATCLVATWGWLTKQDHPAYIPRRGSPASGAYPRIIRMPITRVTAEARAVRRSVSPRTAPGTRRR